MPRRITILTLLLTFLILGTALRFYGMGQMQDILHNDEAYYGLDAVSLIENPRLQIYFPANTGREGVWMWLLTPLVATIGATPLAMRLTSALVGIATLGAIYWLGHETLDDGAVWCVGVLAVLYWHVQLSHIGFRVITMVLFGSLAFASLLRAYRLGRDYWLVGILLGLTSYTYIAARVYIGYAVLWMLWWAIREPQHRKGIFSAMTIFTVMAIPLGLALLFPAETSDSIGRAAANDINQIWENVVNWGNAWLIRGDVSGTHNLSNRPVLDVGLAILALAGLLGVWRIVREKWLILWWGSLVIVSLLPTILSVETPHFLRGAGLIVPLILLLGAGGAFLAQWRFSWLIPLVLIGWSGWNTYHDFTAWLDNETAQFGLTYDYRITEAMTILDAETPPEQAIVMPTDEGYRATADYLAQGMNRDITFYRWSDGDCYLSPRETYTALDLPIVLNSFASRVLPYVDDIDAIATHPDNDYNIFTVTPNASLRDEWANIPTFGDVISAQVIPPTVTTVSARETVTIHWAMRLQDVLPRDDYRVLLHLQGDPTPYDGGTLFATGDAPLCELAYQPQSQADVTLIQQLSLTLPDAMPAGDYHLAMGFYTPDDFTRLTVAPQENLHGYSRVWEIEVVP
ncbi:MAG: hypothetical protein AAF846_15470 [Chloroflexota bacterium]